MRLLRRPHYLFFRITFFRNTSTKNRNRSSHVCMGHFMWNCPFVFIFQLSINASYPQHPGDDEKASKVHKILVFPNWEVKIIQPLTFQNDEFDELKIIDKSQSFWINPAHRKQHFYVFDLDILHAKR